MDERNEVKDFLRNVDEFGCNALTVSKKVLENGKENVTLEMARRRIMPERMESPARKHIFHDADGFIKYIETVKTKNTIVFADVEQATIYMVIDDKAEKGFEIVLLMPPYHPEFTLLEETLIDQEDMNIFEFAKNIMRNRAAFLGSKEESKQLAMLMRQITVSSSIKVCSGVGPKSVNGIMCTTEAKAGTDETEIDLPDKITTNVPIYINTDSVFFDIDITITADRSGEVRVTTDCPELGVRKFEVFQKILNKIAETDGLVVLGRPQTDSWRYNK